MTAIVIIGAGECGVRAAFALREGGYEGEVILIGSECSVPYERPPLSKAGTADPVLIRQLEAYEHNNIELRLGVAVSTIDPEHRRITLGSGEVLQYSQLLLATGAGARLFPGMEGCFTLRTDSDANAILEAFVPGARIGIVGGGFIGLELAAAARAAGAEVTVFEAGPRLLSRAVPEALATVLQARHEAEGIEILTATGVEAVTADSITVSGGSARGFDAVIAGVGSLPNTQLAGTAGLQLGNGIVVDSAFRTSDANVFAAGDCCNFQWRGVRVRLESWKAAQDQAVHAANAMLGAHEPYNKVPWFWSDQYDLTMLVAGLFDPVLAVHSRGAQGESRIVYQCDDEGALLAAAGIGVGNAVAKEIRIFEKLIERGAYVDPVILSDPSQNLKRLLKTA